MPRSHDASGLAFFERTQAAVKRVAVTAGGADRTYGELLECSARIAGALLGGAGDLAEQRVAYLVEPGFHYVATQWGIWRAGGVAVPLAISHPAPELEYTIEDSGASIVVAQPDLAERVRPIAEARGLRFLDLTEALAHSSGGVELPRLDEGRRAMILYTSGTTSRRKGVVTTH